jgi:hypothetical protein
MKLTTARRLTVATLALYGIALTFPGMLPFNRIRPFVAGLPFTLFWITLWILLATLALALLDRAESRAEREQARATERDGEA